MSTLQFDGVVDSTVPLVAHYDGRTIVIQRRVNFQVRKPENTGRLSNFTAIFFDKACPYFSQKYIWITRTDRYKENLHNGHVPRQW